MRTCPTCHRQFDDDSRYCPIDGSQLGPPLAELANADPLVGSVLFGQFELREACGRGAMGTVYHALQRGMDRPVAIKILHRELLNDATVVKRFHREARAVARLQHPNVVTVHLIGETEDGRPFIVMEYVDGTALARVLEEQPVLEPGRALRIVRQVASALAEAHSAGIVHRDLKPANILLCQHRRSPDFVKVVDFGIAKILGTGTGPALNVSGENRLSRTGIIFGTPHYIAPEQASGSPIDHRADLYGAGVLLYRMVTGRLPFDGAGIAVLLAHMQLAPPRPSEIAPWVAPGLEAVILRAMDKDPARRFQSADEFGDAVEGLLAATGPSGPGDRTAGGPSTLDPRQTQAEAEPAGTAGRGAPADSAGGFTSTSAFGGDELDELVERPRSRGWAIAAWLVALVAAGGLAALAITRRDGGSAVTPSGSDSAPADAGTSLPPPSSSTWAVPAGDAAPVAPGSAPARSALDAGTAVATPAGAGLAGTRDRARAPAGRVVPPAGTSAAVPGPAGPVTSDAPALPVVAPDPEPKPAPVRGQAPDAAQPGEIEDPYHGDGSGAAPAAAADPAPASDPGLE